MLVVISTDGYVSGTGAGGWAFVARRNGTGAVRSGPLAGGPSHLAEWIACREALAWALKHVEKGDDLELRTDSALVAKGLASRRPPMSGEAAEHRAACREALARLAERGVRARVLRVGRAENEEADAAARAAALRV